MMPEEEYHAKLFASLQAGEARLKWVSEWLDENIPKTTRGGVLKNNSIGLDLARLIKLNEEMGEVVSNFISFWGMNPRKPADKTLQERDIVDELYDVAFTALGAAAHFQGNGGATLEQFLWKVSSIKTRLKGIPDPHYYQGAQDDILDDLSGPCRATSPLWDGPCGAPAVSPSYGESDRLVPVHLDPKPWFVEEAVQEPGHADYVPFDGRYSYDEWYSSESDTLDALSVWKPRQGYVQEQEAYRGGR